MKGAVLTGKTIRKVHQVPMRSAYQTTVWVLVGVEFTDGSWLRFNVHPNDARPNINGGAWGGGVAGENDGVGIEPVYPGESWAPKPWPEDDDWAEDL